MGVTQVVDYFLSKLEALGSKRKSEHFRASQDIDIIWQEAIVGQFTSIDYYQMHFLICSMRMIFIS